MPRASDGIRKSDLEYWVIGSYSSNILIGRRCSHAVKEDADFHFPTLQVGTENDSLLVIWKFD